METLGEMSKCKGRVINNTEMQVHGKANTFTSTSDMLVSSGLKRRKITFKIILTLYSTLIIYPACAFLMIVVKTVHAHYVFVKIKYSRAPLLPWDDLAWYGLCADSWTLSLCRTGSLHAHAQLQLVPGTCFVLHHAWKISWPNPIKAQVLTIPQYKWS